jgi:AAA family ATP:ADP antiporter
VPDPAPPSSAPTPARPRLAALVALQPGEAPIVLWSASQFFFLLLSYFMLRPVREALGVKRSLDDLPWLMTGTMLVMLLVNPLFAWVVSRMPRRRFIPLVNRFFMLNLAAFAAWFALAPTQWAAYAFYIWLSVFNLFVVSVFWAFMADSHGPERSRRVYGLVAVGGTTGAFLGAMVTRLLTTQYKFEPWMVLVAAIIPLELAVQCMLRVHTRSTSGPAVPAATPAEPGPGILDGLALLFRSRYLGLIALYVLVYAITSTVLYLEQARMISETHPEWDARIAAFAHLDAMKQGATLLVQFFLTARIVKLLGMSLTLAALPLVTLAGFVVLWALPALTVLMWVQVIRHATHHAIDRPTREMLYTAVGPDARYKSKSFIDTFIYRAGDVAGSWIPKGLAALAIPVLPIAAAAAFLWAGIGITLGRMVARTRNQTATGSVGTSHPN